MKKNDNNNLRVNKYDEAYSSKNKIFHRTKVGGLWDEIGKLQIDFLRSQGLLKSHKLLDIGCGCLRGGVKFIDYLSNNCYFGMDSNESLIEAGKNELSTSNLNIKNPKLHINDRFDFNCFDMQFDYMIAFSLFTHLHMNLILLCLKNVKKHLAIKGKFYATFFISPDNIHEAQLTHNPGEIITNFTFDPFHYSIDEIKILANHAGLSAQHITNFNHPRSQSMFLFHHM